MADKQRESCLLSALKLIFVHLVVRILFTILLVLVCLAAAAYFLGIGTPASYPAPKYDASHTSSIANIVTRLARSLVDKDGRVVDTAVLKLSQSEVQTLIDAAIAKSVRPETHSLPYSVIWDNGRLKVHFSMPLFSDKAANLALELSPLVENGNLTLIPGHGSVGNILLPEFALQKAADRLEQMAMHDESVRTMLSAFSRIEPGEGGSLLLMFDPRDVNTVVRVLKSAGEPNEESDGNDDSGDDSGDDRDEEDLEDEEDEEIFF